MSNAAAIQLQPLTFTIASFIKYQKLLLSYIIVSFRPILWP